jgi:ppGpp synthetase/RelA/SpoT-type nucleotidyltranferase
MYSAGEVMKITIQGKTYDDKEAIRLGLTSNQYVDALKNAKRVYQEAKKNRELRRIEREKELFEFRLKALKSLKAKLNALPESGYEKVILDTPKYKKGEGIINLCSEIASIRYYQE